MYSEKTRGLNLNLLVLAPEMLPIRGGAGAYTMEIAMRAPEDVTVHLLTESSYCRNGALHAERLRNIALSNTRLHIHSMRCAFPFLPLDLAYKAELKTRIQRLIDRYDIDLIHSCSTMPDLMIGRRSEVPPIVTTVHSTIEDHYRTLSSLPSRFRDLKSHEKMILTFGPLLIGVENRYYRSDRRFISVSEWGKRNLTHLKGAKPDAIKVIHNGVDGEIYNASRRREGEEAFPELARINKPKVLILSRLTSSKITPYLTDAIRSVMLESNAHFVFAGSTRGMLPKDLRNDCTVLGHVPHEFTPQLYSLCDIFVLASLYENFPISILEAMASECAVVASDIGGIPEVVQDGIHGFLVNPRDATELSRKVSFLAENPSEVRRVGRNAREHVMSNFTWSQAAARTYEFFSEVTCRREG